MTYHDPYARNRGTKRPGHPARDGYVTDDELQVEATERGDAKRDIRAAVQAIRRQSKALKKQGDGESEELHIGLLKVIYRSGRQLQRDYPDIVTELREVVDRQKGSLFALLIDLALPTVAKDVRRTWTEAAKYALEANVRPEKLEGFIAVKGGLVACGSATPAERRREIARWRRKTNAKWWTA